MDILLAGVIITVVVIAFAVCVGKAASRGNCDQCGQYTDHLYNWPDDCVCENCDKERMGE